MANVTILGLGDLGLRIAERLTAERQIERLTLVGRNTRRGQACAALLAASDRVQVDFVQADLLDVSRMRRCSDISDRTSSCRLPPWSPRG